MTGALCPRCSSPVLSGIPVCGQCGFDLAWEQGAIVTTELGPNADHPASISQTDLLRHATLGEYEIITELGRGGMATVYLAHDLTLGRKVALKVISHEIVRQPAMAERFKREARTAAALSHPNVIPIHAVREDEELLYIVMKYVAGRSLDQVLTELRPFPVSLATAILTEAGAGLDYAHRNGVIHRDVKPANIMVDEEGFTVIADFGIAKASEGQNLTRTGTMVGTPAYVSPEICEGQPASPASDQYSLGVVAYELLTGTLPFVAETQLALMFAHIHRAPEPVMARRSDCPVALNDAVMRMLAKAPEERWPSMKHAVAAIVAAVPPESSTGEVIRELAQNRPDKARLATFKTPTSPVPGGRADDTEPAHDSDETVATVRAEGAEQADEAQAFGIDRVIVALGAIVLLGMLAVMFLRPGPGPRPVAAAPLEPAAPNNGDSLWYTTRGAADEARRRAISYGASIQTLAAGDSLHARADSMAQHGDRLGASVVVSQAQALYGEAARSQPRTSTPRATPHAPVRSIPPAVPVATQATPSDSGPSPHSITAGRSH